MLALAHQLVDRQHEITVYARRIDQSLQDSVRVERLPRRVGPQLLDDLLLVPRVSRMVRRGHHEVVCIMGPMGFVPHPYVYYAQFSQRGWRRTWTSDTRPRLYHRLHVCLGAWLEERVAGRADASIACSDAVVTELGVARERATVVPNGIDLGEFPEISSEERATARASFGLAGDTFAIAFIGEYRTPRKGLPQLVAAVAEGGLDEHLLIAGDGDEGSLERTAGALGIQTRVHPLGYRNVRSVIAAADVIVVPSLYEPFSIVALEAAAARRPLILSERAGAARHLGQAAVVVADPENPKAIRDAIDAVRADPVASDQRSEAARRIAEGLTWTSCAARAAAVVESCLARS